MESLVDAALVVAVRALLVGALLATLGLAAEEFGAWLAERRGGKRK